MGGKAIRRAELRDVAPPSGPTYHRAKASITIGTIVEVTTETAITSGGLLAVGGLVAAVLLSTAVLVRSAARQA